MRAIILAMLAGLAGCAADNKFTPTMLQVYGNARIAIDRTNPSSLTVSLLNSKDIGYDWDQPDDRAKLIQSMLAAQCGAPRITGTLVTQTGQTVLGPLRVYTLTVECPNGAFRSLP